LSHGKFSTKKAKLWTNLAFKREGVLEQLSRKVETGFRD